MELYLNAGEKILLKSKATIGINPGLLVLTDNSINFYELNLLRTSIKNQEKIYLSSISVLNGKPRVEIGWNAYKSCNTLVIYTSGQKKEYCFSGQTPHHEVYKWEEMIYFLITGEQLPDEGLDELKEFKDAIIAGGKAIGEAAASLVGNYKKKINNIIKSKEKVLITIKCNHCGAPITGYTGDSVRCKYCDSTIVISEK